MSVSPMDIALYARLATETAELVSNMVDSYNKEQNGEEVTEAELSAIEQKKQQVNSKWNLLAPSPEKDSKDPQ